MDTLIIASSMLFLSTLSLRRATTIPRGGHINKANFYPRSPCGERQALGLPGWLRTLISIHALLAESDLLHTNKRYTKNKFLSTLSLRRATLRVLDGSKSSIISIHALLAESDDDILAGVNELLISIHALLAESDSADCNYRNARLDFYPRSPCGERPCQQAL